MTDMTPVKRAEGTRILTADLLALLPDAEFMVAARAEVPRLITATHAVLELHHRRPHGRTRDGGYIFDFVAHGQTEFPDLCDHCLRTYPCETVTTITTALEAS